MTVKRKWYKVSWFNTGWENKRTSQIITAYSKAHAKRLIEAAYGDVYELRITLLAVKTGVKE